jgi:hypothetical protein
MIVVSILICPRIQNYVAQKCCQSDYKNVGCVSVDFQTGLRVLYQLWMSAKGLTLTGCVTVWNSCQIYVWIWIRSEKFEKWITTTIFFVHWLALSHIASRVALNFMQVFTLKQSEKMSKILKKALSNEPPTTLPQYLVKSLTKGLAQCLDSVTDLKYHSTAFPETTKLTV